MACPKKGARALQTYFWRILVVAEFRKYYPWPGFCQDVGSEWTHLAMPWLCPTSEPCLVAHLVFFAPPPQKKKNAETFFPRSKRKTEQGLCSRPAAHSCGSLLVCWSYQQDALQMARKIYASFVRPSYGAVRASSKCLPCTTLLFGCGTPVWLGLLRTTKRKPKKEHQNLWGSPKKDTPSSTLSFIHLTCTCC